MSAGNRAPLQDITVKHHITYKLPTFHSGNVLFKVIPLISADCNFSSQSLVSLRCWGLTLKDGAFVV